MRFVKFYLFVIILLLKYNLIYAQMFSVEDRPQRRVSSSTFLRAGVGIIDFTYFGDPKENADSESLNISNTLPTLIFESRGISGSATVGNTLFGLKQQFFYDLNLMFSNGFPIFQNSLLQTGIPIELRTGITTSENDNVNDRFSQTNLSVGIGGFLNSSIFRKVKFQTQTVIGYGFSSSNGGFFGGSLWYIHGKARVNSLNFIQRRTLSFGYDYNFKSFDIDDDRYDFELKAHQITLGISL